MRGAALAALAALAAAGCAEEVIVTVTGTGDVVIHDVVVSSGGAGAPDGTGLLEEHVVLDDPARPLPFTIGLALRNATDGPVTVCIRATAGTGAAATPVAGCASEELVRLGANRFEIELCGPGSAEGPALRLPGNASHVGTAIAPDTLRPIFGWDALPEALGYEIQLSTDPSFPDEPGLRALTTTTRHRLAADLAVSMTPPVGARYYWRVRALLADGCSDHGASWYVDVGRPVDDFNGDGYGDLAVGARGHDEPAIPSTTGAGAVYVYYGRPTGEPAPKTADLEIFGSASGDSLGHDVAFAGDVNGDGFSDLVVGAPGAENALGETVGRVYVFHGGIDPDAVPDRVIDALLGQTEAGWSVAGAGDVNADGLADIVFGAIGEVGGTGQFVVLLGRVDDAMPLALAFGSPGLPGDRIGFDVAGVGDLDGDGLGDIAVGAPDSNAPAGMAGAVYVFRGQVVMGTVTPTATLFGSNDGALFGYSVAAAGDVNGDGFADLVVGAPGSKVNMAAIPEQEVQIWLGAPVDLVRPTPIVLLPVEGLSRGFGFAVAGAGDVNRDGYDDVLIGARWTPGTNGVGEAGAAGIYLGAAGDAMDAFPDLVLERGGSSVENFGGAVSSGDFNGDGRSDVMVAAPSAATPSGLLVGKVYIFLHDGTWPSRDLEIELRGERALDIFGFALAARWPVREWVWF